MSKTHWKKMTNPDYMGTYSLENGEDMVVTIKDVRNEMVPNNKGEKEECVVIYFDESKKPMIANKTNLKMIAKVLGSDYIEEWRGQAIQIGQERVSAFGEQVEALRVRNFLPTVEEISCEECGKAIQPGHGMSAAQMAAYTKRKYGKKLCAECATKAAKEA